LDSHAVVGEINALLFLELLDEVADKGDVEVLTTKVGVTVGGLDLEHTVRDLEDGDIEGTSTKIVDGDDTVILLKTVSQSGGSRLVDDTVNVETRDLTSVLGGLTLLIVEVSGNSDDGVLDSLAEEGLSSLLHLAEHETTDLRGRVLLALRLEPCVAVGVLDDLVGHLLDITLNLDIGVLATDETLCGEESVFRVDDSLTLGGDTDKTLALLGETNDRRCCSCTFRVLNYPRRLALHDGDSRIGGTEIDTDDGTLDLVAIFRVSSSEL